MPKGYNYQGKHWTQQPENRARLKKLMSDRASAKRNKFRSLAKQAVRSKRKTYIKKQKKNTSVVLNGWRITLGQDEIKIESE